MENSIVGEEGIKIYLVWYNQHHFEIYIDDDALCVKLFFFYTTQKKTQLDRSVVLLLIDFPERQFFPLSKLGVD